jgi:hypothetical protein
VGTWSNRDTFPRNRPLTTSNPNSNPISWPFFTPGRSQISSNHIGFKDQTGVFIAEDKGIVIIFVGIGVKEK